MNPVPQVRFSRCDHALQARERLVRRGLSLTPEEAGALAGVAGGGRPLDQSEQRVRIAVPAQLAHALDVARRLPLVPELVPRAAPEPGLAGLARASESLLVHVGNRQDLARVPVLDHTREQAVFAEGDVVQELKLSGRR